jgi:hypothetical protein
MLTDLFNAAVLAAAAALAIVGAGVLTWRWSTDGGSAVRLAASLLVYDHRSSAELLVGTVVTGVAVAGVFTYGLEWLAQLDTTTDLLATLLLLVAAVAFVGLAGTVSTRVDRAVAYAHGRANMGRTRS